jgi:hypothetical protein
MVFATYSNNIEVMDHECDTDPVQEVVVPED